MKILNSLIILLIYSTCIYSQNSVSINGLLKTNGNKIENKNGDPFAIAGNSMFWSGFQFEGGFFYESQVVDHLADDWEAGVIRAAMAVEQADGGRGYVADPAGEYAKVKTIIDAAIAKDIYVIVDYHTHHAENYKSEAIAFFTQVAKDYKTNDHIIYEIYNEPIGGSSPNEQEATWDNIIKPYAIDVINAIRAEDPDNLIIVGTPFFSQGVDIASTSQNRIKESDLNLLNGAILNVAYTLHFYAGTHRDSLRAIAKKALDNGVALFVTEWGTVNADGNGSVDEIETKKWIQFMKDNKLSHANWSVSDKAEGASIIQPGQRIQGLLDGKLTASGNFVRCLIKKFNNQEDFTTCGTSTTPTPPKPPVTGGAVTIPTGVGVKVEMETPAGIGQTDAGGARSDFRSPGLTEGTYTNGEGFLSGFSDGKAAVFNLPINSLGTYTIQVIVSSTTAGNKLELKRDSGKIDLADKTIPNTGSLNTYQIVTFSGISFSGSVQDIAVGVVGSGPVNIESFYYTLDNDPALSISSFDSRIANNIKIYPTPAKDVIYINGSSNLDIQYEIFNITGKQLREKSEYLNFISISEFEVGLYLLKLTIKNESKVFKFIKN